MTQLVSIKELPRKVKIKLLEGLGYGSDGVYVLDTDGKKHTDRYTEEPIEVDNMVIFPGSTIILDNNPLSISSYLEEFGDVL